MIDGATAHVAEVDQCEVRQGNECNEAECEGARLESPRSGLGSPPKKKRERHTGKYGVVRPEPPLERSV